MPSWWFPRAKPSEEPTPDDGYDAFFSGDGTEGTTAGTLYRKDFNGVVTPVGGTGGGGGGTYTDEQAQDAVGRILTDTATVDFTYNDGANTITAVVVPGSIGATQIAAGGVGTTQLAANAVDNTKLADMPGATVKGRPDGAAGDPQDLNATQLKALMSFNSTDIGDFTEAAQDAVGAAVRDSASVNLAYNDAAGTITANVQTGGITTGMIQANAITSAQLVADSVTTVKIATGAVTNDELGADAVTNNKLADMPAKTFKANKTTTSANPTDITVPDVKAMLAYTATEIVSSPFGTVAATNVQAALEALYALVQASDGGGSGSEDVGPNQVSLYGDTVVGGANTNAGAAAALADFSDASYITGNDTTFGVYSRIPSFADLASAAGRNVRSFLVILRVAIDSPGGGRATVTELEISGNSVAIPPNVNYSGSGVITDLVFGPFTKGAGQTWTATQFNTLSMYVVNEVAPSRIYKVTVRPTYV